MDYKYLFILAGNYDEYFDTAKKYRGFVGRTVYVRDVESIMGMLEPYKYIVVGTFLERSDANEIAEMIKITGGVHLFEKGVL